MLFRKIITKAHWLIGITLGTMLAIMGLTGGLMAFDREISHFLLGADSKIMPSPGERLTPVELYRRVHAANPSRVILVLTPAPDNQHAAEVEFAATAAVARGAMGLSNGDDRNDIRLIDPYTGALLRESKLSQLEQTFMAWLRQIHQGHWIPGTPLGRAIYNSVGIGAVFLFGMAMTGLYMRWPRGRAARQWRSWFKLNTKLKGRAFLWNLHSVLGTLVFIAYLISAHSGAFQNGTVSFYGNAIRSLIGAPPAGPPPGGSGEGGMGGGPRGMQANPPSQARPAAGIDDSKLWPLFLRELPMFKTATMVITRGPNQAATFTYMPVDEASGDTGIVSVNAVAGTAQHTPPTDVPPPTFAQIIVDRNQDIHEGRIFGKPGVLVMMLAALSMPVFYITGWMMYLQRRRRQRSVAVDVRRPAAQAKSEPS